MRLAAIILCFLDSAILAGLGYWSLDLRHEKPMGDAVDLLVAVLGLSIAPVCVAIFLLTVLPSFLFACLGVLPKTTLTLALFTPVLLAGLLVYSQA